VPSKQESEYDAFPISWVLLHGAVGTLQPAKEGKPSLPQEQPAGEPGQDEAGKRNLLPPINQLVECISRNDVAADELDGRVGI
jgi:hypothetical protein